MVMRFPVASVVELVFGYQLLSADALCKINRNFDRLMRDCCVLCYLCAQIPYLINVTALFLSNKRGMPTRCLALAIILVLWGVFREEKEENKEIL